jgi:hypothetical protein
MSIRNRLKSLEARLAVGDALILPTCGHLSIPIITVYPTDTPLPLPPDPFGNPVCRAGEEPPIPSCPQCERYRGTRRRRGESEIEEIHVVLPAESARCHQVVDEARM